MGLHHSLCAEPPCEVQRDGAKPDPGHQCYLTPPCSLSVLECLYWYRQKGMSSEAQKEADFHSKGPWFNTKVSHEKSYFILI